MYPQVVGHEIVGIAVKVGKNVKHVKVGDRVGVGSQSGSCLECQHCLRRTTRFQTPADVFQRKNNTVIKDPSELITAFTLMDQSRTADTPIMLATQGTLSSKSRMVCRVNLLLPCFAVVSQSTAR